MKRGTIFLAIFLIAAGAIIGVSMFLQNQPPIEIDIAVNPLIEPWVRQSAEAFNNGDNRLANARRVQVNIVQVVDDVDVWRTGSSIAWTTTNRPHGWLPMMATSLTYANYPFEVVQPSIAKTPLIFGGYSSRVDVLTEGGSRPLTWADVIRAAETEAWAELGGQTSWRFVNLAFPLSDRTSNGLAVLFSGAAAVADTPLLDANNIRGDFLTTFAPVIRSVPSFNTISGNVPVFMGRGVGAADIGIAPESQWLSGLSGLTAHETPLFSYPEYAFVFDFPFAVWDDVNLGADERAAVSLFGDWLMNPAQQNSLPGFGLRLASGEVGADAALFTNAAQYGIELNPDFSQLIQLPPLNSTQGLISWFQQTSR